MEHHDWDWSDGASGNGDAETADLNDGPDLGGFEHDAGFSDHFDVPGEDDLSGDHLSGDHLGGDHLGGHEFAAGETHHDGGIEEPLGTENATAHYDESLAHFDNADADDDHGADHGDSHVDEHVGAVD